MNPKFRHYHWRRYRRLIGLVGVMVLLISILGWVWGGQQTLAPSAEGVATASASPSPSVVVQASPITPPKATLPAQMTLGTNLYGIADWSTQLPFIDAFKSSRPWLTQCDGDNPGCDPGGEWDTQEAKLLDLDTNGWVKSLPSPTDPAKFTRVGTIMYWAIPGHYPAGKYIVHYQGEGKVDYEFVQKDEAASRPGRDVIISNGKDGIYLGISQTDPKHTGNYIRDIHVIPEAWEARYQAGEIFNPTFLERTAPFKTLRMMDWMNTNESTQKEWRDRPTLAQSTYAGPSGVPVEVMVTLANQLKANPWFTLPHLASDDYVRNFATYVKENLNPSLQTYVEYSNEVWNNMFPQQQWADTQGLARWGANTHLAYMKWYGSRAAQVARLWKQVFANQSSRVIAVFATQSAGMGIEEIALKAPILPEATPAHQFFDAYAIAAYFGNELGAPENQQKVKAWLKDADGGIAKAFRQIRTGDLLTPNPKESRSLQVALEEVRYHAKVAKTYNLPLVAYEGGQHVVGYFGMQNDDQLTNFFTALNRHPNMYKVYIDLLQGWKQAGGKTFMHFSDIGQPTKWGCWGALEYVTQRQGAPKYQALMDFIQQR